MSIPVPHTWVDEEMPPYDVIKTNIYDVLDLAFHPPMVLVYNSVGQSINSSTWTAITFDSEDIDTDGFHSTTTNPTRVTPTIPGLYRGWYGIAGGNSSAGTQRVAAIKLNGSTYISRTDTRPDDGGGYRRQNGVYTVKLNGTTDYIELVYWHDSGVSRTTNAVSRQQCPTLFLRWLGNYTD